MDPTDAGCIFAGAIDVPIYPTLTPPQVRYILKDSGARVLLIQSVEKFLQLREVLDDCPGVEKVVFLEKPATTTLGISLADLEARGQVTEAEQPDLIDRIAHAIKPDDLATIIYTSGTTGEPKGVMLTHSNLVSNLIDSSGHFSFAKNDSALSVCRFACARTVAMYMYLFHGMAVYFGESLRRLDRICEK